MPAIGGIFTAHYARFFNGVIYIFVKNHNFNQKVDIFIYCEIVHQKTLRGRRKSAVFAYGQKNVVAVL